VKRNTIICSITAIVLCLLSYKIYAVEKYVPWKALLVFNNEKKMVPHDLFKQFISVTRKEMKDNPVFEINDEILPPEISDIGYTSSVSDFASSKKYEKVIFISVSTVYENIPTAVGNTGADQYLIKKKMPISTIEVTIYDVESSADEKQQVFQKKEKLRDIIKKTKEIASIIRQYEMKKIMLPDPFDTYRYYFGVSTEVQFPVGIYAKYSGAGGGFSVLSGLENPYLKNNYLTGRFSSVIVKPKKSGEKHYAVVSFDMGTGYQFQISKLSILPSLSFGYLSHIVSSGFYNDPYIRISGKGSYRLYGDSGPFAEGSHITFFEKKHKGNAYILSVGYQWNYEINVTRKE